ncbi:MAG: hypothetical protein GXO18_05885 [Aquificae bacterium]|nr:hypothetical protein [Aquificota bacterium]
MKLRNDSTEDYVVLYSEETDIDSLPEHKDLESWLWFVNTGIDSEGRLRYFSLDIWNGDPIGLIDDVISYLETHPVPGTYTVEELGLKDVPFVEVLKAIKKLYEQKLTTPTQK